MMTAERPGEADRLEKMARLLDILAAVPNRAGGRRMAIRKLGLSLSPRHERWLLAAVEVWSQTGRVPFQGSITIADSGPPHEWFNPPRDNGDDAA